MNEKNALIIFVRHPVIGKVKTRLAAVVGNDKALHIYKKLLAHTKSIADVVSAEKFIYYADIIPDSDLWDGFKKSSQKQDSDLGNRMLDAFETIFAMGFEKVCIIGSDCYELSADIIHQAYQELDHVDFVIGPAVDGGYYLMGMKKLTRSVFMIKNWSTDTVCHNTICAIKQIEKTYTLLQTLNDVDTVEDVPDIWL